MSRASKEAKRLERKKGFRAHILTHVLVYGSILLGLTVLFGVVLWWNRPLCEGNTVEVTLTVRSIELRHYSGSRYSGGWDQVRLTMSDGEIYTKPRRFLVGDGRLYESFDAMEAALVGKTVTVVLLDSPYESDVMGLSVGDTVAFGLEESNAYRKTARGGWAVAYGIAVALVGFFGVMNTWSSAERLHLWVPSEASRKRARLRRKRREKAKREKQKRKEAAEYGKG